MDILSNNEIIKMTNLIQNVYVTHLHTHTYTRCLEITTNE